MKKIIIIILVIVIIVLAIVFNTGSKTYTYVDNVSKYSIELPNDWKLVNKQNSTTTSDTLFSNGSSTLVIKRFDRTDSVEQAIKFMGKDEFYVFISDQIKSEIDGYSVTATSTVDIDNNKYYKISGRYMGKKSQKEVMQDVYLILTDKSYYIIGFDVYDELYAQLRGEINKIIGTYKLI